MDPTSRQLQRRGHRLAPLPPCASLPPPAADSDGLGPGLPAAARKERGGPCGTSPAPPRAQPDFLRRRAPGTPGQSPMLMTGLRAHVPGLGRKGCAPFGRFLPTLPWGTPYVFSKMGSGRLKQPPVAFPSHRSLQSPSGLSQEALTTGAPLLPLRNTPCTSPRNCEHQVPPVP